MYKTWGGHQLADWRAALLDTTYEADGNSQVVVAKLGKPPPAVQTKADRQEGDRREAAHEPVDYILAALGALGALEQHWSVDSS